jgi:hypothetical protein
MSHLFQLLAGALLTNAVPHLVQGLSGAPFQSPFARPSGVGESSPLVNVWWGAANLVVGAALLARFLPEGPAAWAAPVSGLLLLGSFNARHFEKVRGTSRETR